MEPVDIEGIIALLQYRVGQEGEYADEHHQETRQNDER